MMKAACARIRCESVRGALGGLLLLLNWILVDSALLPRRLRCSYPITAAAAAAAAAAADQ